MHTTTIEAGNNFANAIKREINLIPYRIDQYKKGESFGFVFHNLASPCEMMVKYQGDKLRELGQGANVDKVDKIGKDARAIDNLLELRENCKPNENNWDVIGDIQKDFDREIARKLEEFREYTAKVAPILFFIA